MTRRLCLRTRLLRVSGREPDSGTRPLRARMGQGRPSAPLRRPGQGGQKALREARRPKARPPRRLPPPRASSRGPASRPRPYPRTLASRALSHGARVCKLCTHYCAPAREQATAARACTPPGLPSLSHGPARVALPGTQHTTPHHHPRADAPRESRARAAEGARYFVTDPRSFGKLHGFFDPGRPWARTHSTPAISSSDKLRPLGMLGPALGRRARAGATALPILGTPRRDRGCRPAGRRAHDG